MAEEFRPKEAGQASYGKELVSSANVGVRGNLADEEGRAGRKLRPGGMLVHPIQET
jgi:hypothetical protein